MVISNRAPAHLLGKRRGGFVVRSIGLVLLAAVLCLTSAFGYAWVRYQGNLTAADISDLLDPNPQDDEDSGLRDISAGQPLTFLVLGSDVREGDSDVDGSGASGEITGMRADTTMIVHISADRQRIDVVSIPRDTLVDIPSCIVRTADNKTTTTKEKPNGMFNSAFAIGGQTGDVGSAAACTMRTLQQEMGLNFNGYIVVDFASFVKSVDAIGGVPMYFEESLHDKYAGLNIEAGCRLLDGKQALAGTRYGRGARGAFFQSPHRRTEPSQSRRRRLPVGECFLQLGAVDHHRRACQFSARRERAKHSLRHHALGSSRIARHR